MPERRRVSAVIVRDDRVLMVRERGRGVSGRHDGQEYWTLPGGGIEGGESTQAALAREVLEEVGLTVVSSVYLADFPFPSGPTACFRVEVEAGEPRLGVDELDCDCPRMVGLDWVPLPPLHSESGGLPIAPIICAW